MLYPTNTFSKNTERNSLLHSFDPKVIRNETCHPAFYCNFSQQFSFYKFLIQVWLKRNASTLGENQEQ